MGGVLWREEMLEAGRRLRRGEAGVRPVVAIVREGRAKYHLSIPVCPRSWPYETGHYFRSEIDAISLVKLRTLTLIFDSMFLYLS